MSYLGKSLSIKTLGISNLPYLITSFEIPVAVVKEVNKVIFQFLWKGRTELIRRTTCFFPLQKGGLAIPDISTLNRSIKSKWLFQICDPNHTRPWIQWARYYMGLQLSTTNPIWTFLRSNLAVPPRRPKPHPTLVPTYLWYLQNIPGHTTSARTRTNHQQTPLQHFLDKRST